jgi:hypothetical protein
MAWEKVVPSTPPPHDCWSNLPTTLDASHGNGSIWYCDCERRFVLNRDGAGVISWANA